MDFFNDKEMKEQDVLTDAVYQIFTIRTAAEIERKAALDHLRHSTLSQAPDVLGIHTVLETASVVYLLYLAWKIGTSGEVRVREGERRPMRFYEALIFQWINPKAWMMVLTAATTIHLSADFDVSASIMAAVFYVIGLPCICLWAAFGTAVQRLLTKPGWLRTFNIAMAVLLVASLYPIALRFFA
jgi:threonine/homoserine/homoserine lactone efflux protein